MPAWTSSINQFNSALFKIADHFGEDEITKIKHLLDDKLPKSSEKCTDAFEILKCLVRHGHISEDNPSLLLELCKHLNRPPLEVIIREKFSEVRIKVEYDIKALRRSQKIGSWEEGMHIVEHGFGSEHKNAQTSKTGFKGDVHQAKYTGMVELNEEMKSYSSEGYYTLVTVAPLLGSPNKVQGYCVCKKCGDVVRKIGGKARDDKTQLIYDLGKERVLMNTKTAYEYKVKKIPKVDASDLEKKRPKTCWYSEFKWKRYHCPNCKEPLGWEDTPCNGILQIRRPVI
ncbi:uncharacterized protein LOC144344458 [Saccoglossus kowalevskii]